MCRNNPAVSWSAAGVHFTECAKKTIKRLKFVHPYIVIKVKLATS